MAILDLTIRGAGIFGLSIAWEATLRGAKVRVVDPAGVAAGASGGIVGALAPHTPERWNDKKAFQFESLIMAADFWAGVDAASGLPSGYGRTGRLQPIADEAALTLARERAEQAKTLWQGRASWNVIEAAGATMAPPSPTGLLIHDTLSARIHPRDACNSLAAAIRARGGQIVASDEGPENAPVIWATGHQGLSDLSRALDRPVGNGVKGQAALLAHDARDLPQVFAETLHFIPHGDGTLAIGSTTEREFDEGSATDARLDDLVERARAVLPAIAKARVIQRWAGLRPRAKSRAPMLGPWPDRPGHFIANGGFKIGFGMAPKIAAVMADLVLEGRGEIPADFRVEANL